MYGHWTRIVNVTLKCNFSESDTSSYSTINAYDGEAYGEDVYKRQDFDISEAGILTSYKGTDSIVEIPDTVTSIGYDAFEASPNANNIKQVILGKAVQNIDAHAFISLTALKEIKVSKYNTCLLYTSSNIIIYACQIKTIILTF